MMGDFLNTTIENGSMDVIRYLIQTIIGEIEQTFDFQSSMVCEDDSVRDFLVKKIDQILVITIIIITLIVKSQILLLL